MRSFHMVSKGILLEFQEGPEGGYTVTVPALPVCVSYGETFERALDMIKDAMQGWLEVALAEEIDIPDYFQAAENGSADPDVSGLTYPLEYVAKLGNRTPG